MNLAHLLSSYINLNLLILLGYGVVAIYSTACKRLNRPLASGAVLKLNYFTLASIPVIAVLQPFLPKKAFFEPAAKIWAADSIQSFSSQYSVADPGGTFSIPTVSGASGYDAKVISLTLSISLALILLAAILFIARDLYRLIQIKYSSHVIRQLGQVSIHINHEIAVPFSYWTPQHCNVVIPESLLARSKDFRIAIIHELQHHRQHDTLWVYGVWILRFVCLLNPFIHLWSRKLAEVQEFACDEALVDQGKVESQQYARCLLEVAQTALNQKQIPACATGLAFLVERNLLKRRIENMTTSTNQKKRSASGWVAVTTFALMLTTAYAAQEVVQDRRITLTEAKNLAMKTQTEDGFPIVINDLVLKQLNRYIGTPEGRVFIRASVSRMNAHQALISEKLLEYGVPAELITIPIVESGFQNLAESHLAGHGAGLWMFIVSTARNYGLIVDQTTDERLDINLETDAAMRYLKSNYVRFNDWPLAVLGYNMGENHVMKAIKQTGSRDAWTLIRQGYEGDQDYLARLVATMIILKNPQLFE